MQRLQQMWLCTVSASDLILGSDSVLLLLVLVAELLCLLHHAIDLLLGEAARVVGDGNLVLVAGRLVLRTYVQDTVRVQVERHLNLRHTTRSRGNSTEFKFAELQKNERHTTEEQKRECQHFERETNSCAALINIPAFLRRCV